METKTVNFNGVPRTLNVRKARDSFRDYRLSFDRQFYLSEEIKESLDLRPEHYTVPDQYLTGFCTGFAAATAVEFQIGERPSELLAYALGADRDSWADTLPYCTGGGSDCKSVLDGMRKVGMVNNDCWPFRYPPEYYRGEGDELLEKANRWKISGYINLGYGQEIIQNIKKWLSQKGPVLLGAVIDNSFAMVKEDGIVSAYHNALGGHAIVIAGYEEVKVKERFIIENSWGHKYGDIGRCYVTEEWLITAFLDAYGIVF